MQREADPSDRRGTLPVHLDGSSGAPNGDDDRFDYSPNGRERQRHVNLYRELSHFQNLALKLLRPCPRLSGIA